ncbi:cadherin domain-containing protein [bacterium]|nr:cadherin domain-containing protein [bacterium]
MILLARSGAVFTTILLLLSSRLCFALNAPPEIDLNGPATGANISATFTEDAGFVELCPAATITDDGTTLTELRLKMTPHPEDMSESLSAIPMEGLAVTYNFGAGEMLINGNAPASIYQEVLRTLAYNNASHTPTPTTRVIEVVANDGTNLSAARTITVTVVPVNDKPVVDLNGSSYGVNQTVSFYPGGPVTIAPAGALTDPDGGSLTSMTLTLAPRPNGALETLSATGGGGVTVSYNASTGALSLSGTALLSVYQSALRTVAYNNTAATPDPTTRTLTVTAQDPGGAKSSATAKIRMMVNHAPTGITPLSMSIAENSPIGTVVGSLSTQDPDTTNTHAYAYALPYANGGKFSISGNQIKVGASLNYESTSTIMVTVKSTDNGGLSVTKDITISVTNVNEAPTDILMIAFPVNKNSVVNDLLVANLATIDPDAAQAFAYTFTAPNNNAGGRFKIVSGTIRVANAAQIKADSQIDYPVTIRSTDQGGLGFTKSFTIRISNSNAARKWIVYQ